jgi:acetylornithine deacetylase/succinyl-diaminopimelate desuccinylase-like protein
MRAILGGSLAAVLLLVAGTSWGQTLPPADHSALARAIFQELIEINTTRDSGASRATNTLARRLKSAGFGTRDLHVVGPKPHKQNLVVRLRGTGKLPPVLFLAHLDVVEARREDWSMEPFKLTEQGGYFYGRGTMDIKGEASSLVANLLRLKNEGFRPDRDLIVALTDDEEGGDDNGVQWLLQNRPDLVKAAYVINTDAGGGQMENGRRLRNPVQTSEKIYATYLLEVTGKGGHSSLPPGENAIYTLAQGLSRLAAFNFPVRLNAATRSFFSRLAEQDTGQVARDLKAVSGERPDAQAAQRLTSVPLYNSSMRTTCVATMLNAGHAENALPQRAQATVQCRLLPDESPEKTRSTLVSVLADSLIKVALSAPADLSPASPPSPEVMSAVETVTTTLWPGVIVLPVMDPWTTDGRHFRASGTPVYGVSGIFYDIADVRAHGKDERILVQSYYEGVEFGYRLMKALTH